MFSRSNGMKSTAYPYGFNKIWTFTDIFQCISTNFYSVNDKWLNLCFALVFQKHDADTSQNKDWNVTNPANQIYKTDDFKDWDKNVNIHNIFTK